VTLSRRFAGELCRCGLSWRGLLARPVAATLQSERSQRVSRRRALAVRAVEANLVCAACGARGGVVRSSAIDASYGKLWQPTLRQITGCVAFFSLPKWVEPLLHLMASFLHAARHGFLPRQTTGSRGTAPAVFGPWGCFCRGPATGTRAARLPPLDTAAQRTRLRRRLRAPSRRAWNSARASKSIICPRASCTIASRSNRICNYQTSALQGSRTTLFCAAAALENCNRTATAA
jgi:hypothetical protein